ncbi:hypothetical protein N7451_009305 [Penicillium sp. IBT 35674x]|nr:hypothetical protein N7451_009305 [Penicillium sp. IBT 35674x]
MAILSELVTKIYGSLEMRNLHFRYPNRPKRIILNGLSLNVHLNQYIGLMGASGYRKSTIIALLERFFDPKGGRILIDGKDISRLNIKSYRSYLTPVSQESTLYQGTIRDNITLETNDEDVSEEKIIKVYKAANIHDFQQRIVIIKALLHDPRILLLDEANSALDSESEKVVQDALNAAAQGRTTIAVAHRISTVQKVDCIYGRKIKLVVCKSLETIMLIVLHKGNVVEQGHIKS